MLIDKKFYFFCDWIFMVSYFVIYKICNININLNKFIYYFIVISYRCLFLLWKLVFFFNFFLRERGYVNVFVGMLLFICICILKFLYEFLIRLFW